MNKVLLIAFVFLLSLSALAQSSSMKKLEVERKRALEEISNTDILLQASKKTTSSILNRMQLLSNQLSSRQKVVDLLNKEVEQISKDQLQIEIDIMALDMDLKERQKSYVKAIDGMLENRHNQNKILFVLSGKSLTESYRRFQYLKEYSEWRGAQADEIMEKKERLKEKENDLTKSKYEKEALLRQREREQVNLKKEETNFQQEANQAKGKEKELQKLLAQKKKHAESLDKQIEKLIAEEIERQEKQARLIAEKEAAKEAEKAAKVAKAAAIKAAKETAKAKPSTKPKTKPSTAPATKPTPTPTPTPTPVPVATKADIHLSANFSANRGKLPYPISGNYSIVGRFGNHYHKQWGVTTISSGIDIQSQAGAMVRAVFDGEVSIIAVFPGYNNGIIVRHGGYFTFYGNVQNLMVKKGDVVKTGQNLGQVYTDPDTNLSLLHFQIWRSRNKLNPEPWLRR